MLSKIDLAALLESILCIVCYWRLLNNRSPPVVKTDIYLVLFDVQLLWRYIFQTRCSLPTSTQLLTPPLVRAAIFVDPCLSRWSPVLHSPQFQVVIPNSARTLVVRWEECPSPPRNISRFLSGYPSPHVIHECNYFRLFFWLGFYFLIIVGCHSQED